MNKQVDFQTLLFKIQDLLSDSDRQSFHFLLGEDVPNCCHVDPSFGEALRMLESLFDKESIINQDCVDLTEELKKICGHDPMKRLQASLIIVLSSFLYLKSNTMI